MPVLCMILHVSGFRIGLDGSFVESLFEEATRNGDSSIRLAWTVLALMGLAPPYA